MSDGGKLDRPGPAHEPKAPQGGEDAGYVPSGRGVSGVLAERGVAVDEARFRMTGGAAGTPPLARVENQRQHAAADAVRRIAVQRKSAGSGGSAPVPKTTGVPLPGATREQMQQKLGADLSEVRVHTSGEAEKAAQGFSARAFTVGQDIHFGRGEFSPGSKEGDRLLAHELAHTVQAQKSGIQRKETAEPPPQTEGHEGAAAEGEEAHVSEPGEPAEKEADAVADKAADELHGDGGKKGTGEKESVPATGSEKAPQIGAKILDGSVLRAAKGDEKNDEKKSPSPKMFGANGTQVTSMTVWKGKGKERIDVENPNPGKRPGQIHYQDNEDNKYLYDPATKAFKGAPNKVAALLQNPAFQAGIAKAMNVLGEKS